MWRNYQELEPYMTLEQKSRPHPIGAFDTFAENYLAVFQHGRAEDAVVLRTCKEHLTNAVTSFVPLMIADLDDLAKKLKAIT